MEKNLLSSNISSTCPHNMVNFGQLAAEIDPVVWGTPAKVSRLGSVTAQHFSIGRQPNCGVEQRVPPIFGRAAITLGIAHILVNSYFYIIMLAVNLMVCF